MTKLCLFSSIDSFGFTTNV